MVNVYRSAGIFVHSEAAGYIWYWKQKELVKGKNLFAAGNDSLFAVSLDTKGITANGSIADTTGRSEQFYENSWF